MLSESNDEIKRLHTTNLKDTSVASATDAVDTTPPTTKIASAALAAKCRRSSRSDSAYATTKGMLAAVVGAAIIAVMWNGDGECVRRTWRWCNTQNIYTRQEYLLDRSIVPQFAGVVRCVKVPQSEYRIVYLLILRYHSLCCMSSLQCWNPQG